MKDFYTNVLLPLFSIAALISCVAFCVLGAARMFDKAQCNTYAEITGRATKYEFFGCYVQASSGKWYMYEEFKNRMVATGDEK